MHVTVLGATGGAGAAITQARVEAGLETVAVNRTGSSTVGTARAADIGTDEGLRAAVADSDVVVMAAQPEYHRWPEEFPPMLERVINATAEVGAKLVMVDNLYAYGPGAMPITEATPHRATDAKGRVRSEMIRMLLDAHEAGRLRVTIGQASDYVGPGAENSAITATAVAPVRAGKGTARWMLDLDQPHAIAYLPDVARAYVTLVTDERADGSAWVLPHAGAPTGREFIAALAEASGREITPKAISKGMLRMAAPFHKPSKETLGIAHQWDQSWTVDSSAFEATFGTQDRASLADVAASVVGASVRS